MAKLLERVAFDSTSKVDRENGIVGGVPLIGLVSLNNRRYLEEALRKSVGLYEGALIYINHVKPGQSRDVRDIAGVVRNAKFVEGKGLVGEAHYLKGDPAGEKLAALAEGGFPNVGMSHDAEGRVKRIGGENVVEEITAVNSVDVVHNPATTKSFREQTMKTTLRKLIEATPYKHTAKLLEMLPELAAEEPIDAPEMPETDSAPDPVDAVAAALGAKVLDAIKDPDVDDAAVGAMAKAASKTVASVRADMEPKAEKPADDKPDDAPADEKTTEAIIAKAIAKANAPLLEKLAAVTKRDDARSILESKGAQATPQLLEELTACPDRKSMESLAESWTPAKLGKQKPAIGRLQESSVGEYPKDQPAFVRALKRS